MNSDERRNLLEHTSKLAAGEAENVSLSFKQVFLPLDSHKLALRSEIVVVRGGRGAGKSALFKILQEISDKRELHTLFNDDRIPDAEWIDAFSQSIDHPDVAVLDAYGSEVANDLNKLRAFWLGHLLRRLDHVLKVKLNLPTELRKQWNEQPQQLRAWVPIVQQEMGLLAQLLDQCERELQKQKKFFFATYDHLDRIGLSNPDVRRNYVGALLAMWLSFANRYSHLRPKIFLREDLFNAAEVRFPDASKLRARSVSIDWDVKALYCVVIRYMSATSADLRNWLKKIKHGFVLKEIAPSETFGWMPGTMNEEIRKAFATRLAGELVGKGGNKGYTYRWIPNHLQDAQRRIVPRSFLNLIGFAAESAQNNLLNKGTLLFRPQDLFAALEKTSKARVREICEEYPLVKRLENLRGLNVMLDPKVAEQKLGQPLREEQTSFQMTDGKAVMEELLHLGVISIRPDGRIDVPDIYRSGFGIKRKGGIGRAK